MDLFRIEYRQGNLFLPELGLWLDPHLPQRGAEPVFVSHAHSDHIAEHREVILSPPTSKLMQARMPGERLEHVLEFGESKRFEVPGKVAFKITLFPAGHIFGSALARVEAEGRSLLYTGDFKLRASISAETCQPQPADELIMETTFGRPQYVFPPTQAVLEGVARFCREALENDETPVLLGYSLGKSQELLCGLGEAGFPLMLHGTIFRLTRIYEEFGRCFPKYERYEAGSARGKVLLCPPNVANSAMLRKIGKTRSAILTGWAVDPNCRYRYQCDAAFPLSDHADYPDLLQMVKQVNPKRVYTLHGFASDFAQTLRDAGYAAQALSEDEQFSLGLTFSAPIEPLVRRIPSESTVTGVQECNGPFFSGFAQCCEQVRQTPGKLEKVRLLANYLQSLPPEKVGKAALWFSGRPFALNENRVLQLGWSVIRDALIAAASIDSFAFHQVYLKYSDLGETAGEILASQEPAGLTLEQICQCFDKLHAARGPLAKRPVLQQALAKASALEAKYIIKIITGDLRIGLKEGLVEEAIASAFSQPADAVRRAHLLLGDIGETARIAAAGKLQETSLEPFRPVRFMLASPEETAATVWERMSKADGETNPSEKGESNVPTPVWIEDKYDGIRCQAHKAGSRVVLYSRDLKDITATFREIADDLASAPFDCILDGEMVAIRGPEILPFAELQKRLGRREGDLFMRDEVPIRYVAFDLLWLNGQSLMDSQLSQRRAALESLRSLPQSLRLAHVVSAKSPEEIESAFQAARDRRNEGLMIKQPGSVYAPGRRGLAWVKLKKAQATLDCVVVGAEYGHGKRSQVLSDYTFAVRDERNGELKNIGKAYTGLTDEEIAELTQRFMQSALRQRGRFFEVKPEVVLEIAFDKLQRSDRHSSGIAMRFPRIIRIRTDKGPADIDTLQTAQRFVKKG